MKSVPFKRVVATATVSVQGTEEAHAKAWSAFINKCLSRFIAKDFGKLPEEDADLNRLAMQDGSRLMGVYPIPKGEYPFLLDGYQSVPEKLWIIADAVEKPDMARIITLLFPSDY